MKRLIALVLSLVMALSLCTPAWGVGITNISTDDNLPEGIPVAEVTPYTDTKNIEWGNYGQWSPTEGLEANLEAAFTFKAPHDSESVKTCDYANWYCDFYVKLDKDLGANQIFLGGNYGSFGWIGFHNGDVTLNANEELPLLGSVTNNPWTYADIASFVGEFICGVGDVNDALSGATFTVMLRLTNPENEAESYNVAIVEYTFDVVAEVGGVVYKTLQDAVNEGGEVKLLSDVTLTSTLNITKDTVINGNGYTLTYTGTNRAIDVKKETNGADLTINNLTIAFPKGYRERGINYNTTGTLTLNNVTVGSETAFPSYAVNFPGSANGATAVIDECDLYGCIALNVWSKDMTVTVTDSNLTTVDNAAEAYSVVKLNNDGATSAEGSVINVSGGSINIIGSSTNGSKEFYNATGTGAINIDTPPGGSVDVAVAAIRYGNNSYTFYSVQAAINHAVTEDKASKENPVTVYVLESAATNGGSFTTAEGVTLVLPEGYALFADSGKYTVKKVVAMIGDVNYATLQDAVDAVADKGTIVVKVVGETATVKTAKTFTVTGEKATITAAKGFVITEDKGVYTVSVYVAPPATDVPAADVESEVAAPSVETTVDTSNKSETEQEVIKDVADALQNDNAVKFDETTNNTLSDEAEKIADEKVTVTDEHIDDLNELFTETVTEDDVAVVVQTNFEVKVEDVSVEDGKTTVTLDITPVYQKVVTTKDVAENANTEIVTKGDEQNAVVVEKGELEITEPVEIKIAIPKALAVSDGANGYKSLYVTHEKDNGTKYVYEAKVEGDDVNGYTATFLNPNGFSSFTLSAVNSTAVTMDGMNYVDLQSAINDLGKGATITILSGDHTAVVSGSTSFMVVLENGATANITAANGYKVIMRLVNGVYMYNVREVTAGGYYPSHPGTSSKPTTSKPIQSADTFDAGIAMYVGMSVMAAAGSVVVLKKRED